MKALLISENNKKTELMIAAVKESGNSPIHYRYFMKALDNIEEISPEVIIIDTEDFPRHWKVLCQFTSSELFEEPVKVILYVPENFSEEDIKKSEILKVFGIIRQKENQTKEELMEDFLSIINNSEIKKNSEMQEEKTEASFCPGEKLNMDENYSLYTVDNLLIDKSSSSNFSDADLCNVDNLVEEEKSFDKLCTVDNLIVDDDLLCTVDNLILATDELYTVDNLFEGMEDFDLFGSEIEIEDYDETEVSLITSKENEINEEFTESEQINNAEIPEKLEAPLQASIETPAIEEEYEEESPTVSALLGEKNPDEEVKDKDQDLLNEIQNVFSANLRRNITEEDIQNEYSIYSVDNLFGLEENDYNISTVDNLFYRQEDLTDDVPKNENECKELMGSLLKRIMKYYEK